MGKTARLRKLRLRGTTKKKSRAVPDECPPIELPGGRQARVTEDDILAAILTGEPRVKDRAVEIAINRALDDLGIPRDGRLVLVVNGKITIHSPPGYRLDSAEEYKPACAVCGKPDDAPPWQVLFLGHVDGGEAELLQMCPPPARCCESPCLDLATHEEAVKARARLAEGAALHPDNPALQDAVQLWDWMMAQQFTEGSVSPTPRPPRAPEQ